jgi:hypothetical protein
MINKYMHFLRISGRNKLPVDLAAERLLDEIALKWNSGIPMTVMESMSLRDIASPATLHRKLGDLLDSKLIEMEFRDKNRRTKYLMPTSKSISYFEKMGLAIIEAAKNTAVAT